MKKVYKRIKKMFFVCSGDKYYYNIDKNSSDDRLFVDEYDSIKFLVHGYTDKVRFNETGKL